jgi:hypothetical protein
VRHIVPRAAPAIMSSDDRIDGEWRDRQFAQSGAAPRIVEKLEGVQVRASSVGRACRAAALFAMYIAPWLFTRVTMMASSHR